MNDVIKSGVWPTMITPYTQKNEIDYKGLEVLIEWYIKGKVDGLFAVCLSSEMFHLSLDERIDLARFIVKKVNGRVSVIASGNVSEDMQDQVEEIKKIADTGVDSVVLLTNRIARQDDTKDTWIKNLDRLLSSMPENINLGMYECPVPYKWLLSQDEIKWCADSKRFLFLKDTCCDVEILKTRLKLLKGTNLKLFNANAATLLFCLEHGAAGYSGVLANFFPQVLKMLVDCYQTDPEKALEIQNFIGSIAAIESRCYPLCAKQFLQLEGLDIGTHTRNVNISNYLPAFYNEIEQLHAFGHEYIKRLESK